MSLGGRLRALAGPFLARGAEGIAVQRNVGWLTADRLVRLAVGTVLNVWTINYLRPQGFGLFSFAQSIAGILAILSQLGLETILVRDLVRDPGRSGELLGSTLALRLGGSVAVIVASALVMMQLRPGDATALRLVVIFASTYFFLTYDVIESWFQSRTRVASYVIAKGIAFAIASTIKAWALFARARIEVIALTLVSDWVLAALATVIAYRRDTEAPRRWRVRRETVLGLLRDAWPLLLNNVAFMLSIRLDQVMLTTMRGEHENGIFAVAPRFTEILYFIPTSIHFAATPALLRSYARGEQEYERRLTRVFTALTWIAIAIALPISLLSPWIVRLLLKPDYAPSAPVWAIHIWSAPAFFMAVGMTNWFIARNEQSALFVRSLVAVVANVALNLWMIPAWGARGAAVATLVSQVAAFWLANAFFPSTRRLFRLQCRSLIPRTRKVDPEAPDS